MKFQYQNLAEAGGFEPPVRLPVRQFSKLVVSATHPNFLPLRFLADSNRRTRFCRPLTKPLIQGTNYEVNVLPDCGCKGTTIFVTAKLSKGFLCIHSVFSWMHNNRYNLRKD